MWFLMQNLPPHRMFSIWDLRLGIFARKAMLDMVLVLSTVICQYICYK